MKLRGMQKRRKGGKAGKRSSVEADLKQLSRMAFGRLWHCGDIVKRFHGLSEAIEQTGEAERIWNIHSWLLTPFTLWPIEFEGCRGSCWSSWNAPVWECGLQGKRNF